MKSSPIPVAAAHRIYVIQMLAALFCYTVVLGISVKLTPSVSPRWLQVIVALAPAIPVVFMLMAIIRLFGRIDEMRRQLHTQAAALAAAGTALLAVICGFLQNVGVPPLSGFWTFGVIDLLYAIFILILTRRYR